MNYLAITLALILTNLDGPTRGMASTADANGFPPEARAYHLQGPDFGVTTRRLNIRSSPSANGRRLSTTNAGDTVVVLSPSVRNRYLHVATAGGVTGWVIARNVKLLSSINPAARETVPLPTPVRPPAAGGDAATWEKPAPVELQGGACAAQGLGKNGKRAPDPQTDLRKNRIDTADAYHPVTSAQILALPWSGLPRRRAGWSSSDSLQVVRYEGPPVALQGYLVDVVEEGPESTNCEIDTPEWHDWHMWLVPTASEAAARDRKRAVVVEVTPRLRARSPNWILPSVKALARNGEQVRISGWLMWDPDHPDQVGKTRGTTWEIHPVTRIEVFRAGSWTDIAHP
ncbi:MAG: hypothetical protein NVSMB53_07430 [Gemmatimonadaceae bacterium]